MGFFQISWLPSNKRGSAEEESLFSNLHARLPAGCSRLQAPGSLAPWHLGTLAPSYLPGSQDGILPNLLASLKQARFGRGRKLVFKSSRASPRGMLQASGFLASWLLRICQGARMGFFQISWLP
jgi:hypothetical protein